MPSEPYFPYVHPNLHAIHVNTPTYWPGTFCPDTALRTPDVRETEPTLGCYVVGVDCAPLGTYSTALRAIWTLSTVDIEERAYWVEDYCTSTATAKPGDV